MDQIKVRIMEVTPAMAARWLDKNVVNRILAEPRVNGMVNDMLTGRFRLTHQGVAFGADDTLYDGQHRLTAIVQSGCTVRMMVTTGLPEEVRPVIDASMRTRTVSDNLHMFDGMKNAKRTVARVNIVELLTVGHNRTVLSVEQVRDRVAALRKEIDWSSGLFQGASKVDQAPVVGALMYAFKTNPEVVRAFGADLKRGAGLAETSPAWLLREALNGASVAIQAGGAYVLARKTLGALAAYIDKRSVRALYDFTTYKTRFPGSI